MNTNQRQPQFYFIGPARRVVPIVFPLVAVLYLISNLPAQQPASLQFTVSQTNLTLHASNDVALYYLVAQSTNLPGFSPWSMKLGNGGPSWSVTHHLTNPSFADSFPINPGTTPISWPPSDAPKARIVSLAGQFVRWNLWLRSMANRTSLSRRTRLRT